MINKYCPICGEENMCKSGSNECWCHTANFPPGIFELIPEEARGKQCICQTCLNQYLAENMQNN